jgi:hypothetical protein
VPAKPNDLNVLQKLLFYLASSRFPFFSTARFAQERHQRTSSWPKANRPVFLRALRVLRGSSFLFKPPASLKNATNEHLPGRRPTDLFFFVLFVSFVVQAFFLNRPLRSRTPKMQRRPPTNIFLAEGQQTCFSSCSSCPSWFNLFS